MFDIQPQRIPRDITFKVQSVTRDRITATVESAPDGAGVAIGETISLIDPDVMLCGNAMMLVGHTGAAIQSPDGWRVTEFNPPGYTVCGEQ